MPVRVELRRDAGRVGARFGPWIRRKQIARIVGPPDPSELAQVVDKRGETVGWGLLSPVSLITVRLVKFGEAPPNDDWLPSRLASAILARQAYDFESEQTTGYRLVNSEGDGLPGLVVDRYGDTLVVQITTAPMAAAQDRLIDALRTHWPGAIHVVLPASAAKHEGFEAGLTRDDDRQMLSFSEHGLALQTPAPPAQKTGAYHDQRGNRRVVAHLARRHGGRLLDLGTHVGGFALHAAKLGAEVVALDQSKAVLEVAKRNAANNGIASITWVEGDMFAPLRDPRLDGPFGTAVLDPPKIAGRKRDVDQAMGAMERMVGQIATRIDAYGHIVLCSCSHHIGRDQLDRVFVTEPGGRRWTRVQTLGAGFDHPVAPAHLEGEYLRVGVYQARS